MTAATKRDAADWKAEPDALADRLEAGAEDARGLDMPPLESYGDNPAPPEPAAQPAFRLVRVSDMQIRPIAYLVRGFYELDSLAMTYGDPGCGKSFQGVSLACAVATGTDWYGQPTKQGPVVYIAGEGHNGLKRRFSAWEIHYQRSLDDAPLFVSTMAAAMSDPSSAATVRAAVDEVATEHGAPALVVLDTLARNFGPGDENSTQDMTAFVAAADAIRTRYGCTVLLVHHTGHADKTRARGAMALKGALDAEYRMDKDESGVVRFEAKKMKDGPLPEPMAFRLCPVELGIQDEEGRAVTSAVLEPTSYEAEPKGGRKGRGKWQIVALGVLEALRAEHEARVEAGGRDPASARVLVDDWRQSCLEAGIPKPRFYETKNSLLENELIHVAGRYVR